MNQTSMLRHFRFEPTSRDLNVELIDGWRSLSPSDLHSIEHLQMLKSVAHIGVVKPLVAIPEDAARSRYLVLDGAARLSALRAMGATSTRCVLPLPGLAVTDRLRLNRLTVVQEHRIITRAIEAGVPVEWLSKVFGEPNESIVLRTRTMDRISADVLRLLEDKPTNHEVFRHLRRVEEEAQLCAANAMVMLDEYSARLVKAVLKARDRHLHPNPAHLQSPEAERLSCVMDIHEQLASLAAATAGERSSSSTVLELVIIRSHIRRLLSRPNIVGWLVANRLDDLRVLQEIANMKKLPISK